jgi:formylglycine-generating enzyme required for sulfatase activity/uncharacterized caspase-like protein
MSTTGRKLALIVTNSRYEDDQFTPLTTPERDGVDLQGVLEETDRCGFEVTRLHNRPHYEITEHVEAFFTENKKRDDLLLFYFSGHGVLQNGRLNFAVANTKSSRINSTGVNATFVAQQMNLSLSRRKVIILDCCHSGAFLEGAKGETLNADVIFNPKGSGQYVLTATNKIEQAWEGHKIDTRYRHSVFTHHLIEGLKGKAGDFSKELITVDDLYAYISDQISAEPDLKRKQTPEIYIDKGRDEIVIARKTVAASKAKLKKPVRPSAIRRFLEKLDQRDLRDVCLDIGLKGMQVNQTPDQYTYMLMEMVEAQSAWEMLLDVLAEIVPEQFEARFGKRQGVVIAVPKAAPKKKPVEVVREKSKPTPQKWSPPTLHGIEWVEIPAGPFWMGAAEKDDQAGNAEKPGHKLELPTYWIGKTAVTNTQYMAGVQAGVAKAPSHWKNDTPATNINNHPVVRVSWDDAIAYCKWLSQESGLQITLPSEAEWEKAARGAKDQRIYPWGDTFDTTKCNSKESGIGTTTPAGKYPKGISPYGVLDMGGNVWEWTRSKYIEK